MPGAPGCLINTLPAAWSAANSKSQLVPPVIAVLQGSGLVARSGTPRELSSAGCITVVSSNKRSWPFQRRRCIACLQPRCSSTSAVQRTRV